MRMPAQSVGFVAVWLAITGLMVLLSAGVAGAHCTVKAKPDGASVTISLSVGGETCSPPNPETRVLDAVANVFVKLCRGVTSFLNIVVVGGSFNFGTKTARVGAFALGTSAAGGNQIETLPDSLVAAVGLYVPGGGTNLMPPPPDSMLGVTIQRSGTQVTLTIPTIVVGGVPVGAGGMQVRAANANETSIAEFKVIVYPDSNAANTDINHDGFGSAFYGDVVLEAGVGVNTGYGTSGGFSNSDFILQPEAGSKYTLRPIAGLTKIVNVPSGAANAVVLTIGDPRSVSRPVPGSSPIGLALLALALMGSGLWVMRFRGRADAAQ